MKSMNFMTAEWYKDIDISYFGDGFTVCFEGDEIYFGSLEEAKEFIDENEGGF